MIIRVFSSFGSKRIEVHERESVKILFGKIENEFKINDFRLSRKRNGDEPIKNSSVYIGNIGLRHGDIVYMHSNQSMADLNGMEVDGDITVSKSLQEQSRSKIFRQEDEIDKILSKMDGRIYRQRNAQNCRHGPSNKCIHCVPLEPFDEEYLEHCDPPIKFISFHAYLRKLSGGLDQGKFASLDNIQCKIRPGCREHLPWPNGICTKCQPSAITLSVQKYRHVDNIMFENAVLMNDFLDYWRKTGNQRIGIMFGYYTTFDQAPLGIKAVVTAIYEPEQKSCRNSVELLNLQNEEPQRFILSNDVQDIAKTLGLSPVGWIFTDLIGDDPQAGAVKQHRGTIDTFFMTAQECITAARLQNMFPNICNLSNEGQFGSKFVTVVVTGDCNKNIHFEGYQVSNQCMALVRDDILVPTKDAPELGYVRESTGTKYVPDVFCNQKDKYGNTVTSPGRPLPVEFLLVHMAAAFAKEEQFSIAQRTGTVVRFPIENRSSMGEQQNKDSLIRYMNQFTEGQLSEALTDVHLLWYLYSCTDIDEVRGHVLAVCGALSHGINAKNGDEGRMERRRVLARTIGQLKSSRAWNMVFGGGGRNGESSVKCDGGRMYTEMTEVEDEEMEEKMSMKMWSCEHCTFDNGVSESSCQMCGLPR